MVTNVFGNVLGNQNSLVSPLGAQPFPMAQGTSTITGPFGVGETMIRGVGTSEIGPYGISSSVPWAPGFSATPANTVNGLGLASPFAQTSSSIHNVGMNGFGQVNPYSPLHGTPVDLNNGIVMAMGSFGGYQNPMSPYSGSLLPQSIMPDGSFGFGGPGGSQPGNFLDSVNFGGLGMGSIGSGGLPMAADLGGSGAMVAPPMMLNPSTGGLMPVGGGGAPTVFGNPTLFQPVNPNITPGVAQSFNQVSGDISNQYNVISDGVAKLFFQGNSPQVPRQMWGSGSVMRSPLGIFETGIGWAGGNANAGWMGAQASGMAWAMTRNPINPSMIVSYANPYYNNYNWNQGFSV